MIEPIENQRFHLFTDGSVNTQSKVGYGAYFMTADIETSISLLKESIKVKRFEETSSTKLELQTLLWALDEMLSLTSTKDITLTMYTDSQNIIDLPRRRECLEKNNYFSNKNRRLNNYELYREFYRLT